MRDTGRIRTLTRALVAVATAAAAALAVVAAGPPAPAAAQTAPLVSEVEVTGRGYGHGRGMGQYGSFGYARDHGWSWQQITDHFYGGTTLGSVPETELDVLLKAYGTGWTLAIVESGTLVVPGGPTLTGPAPGRPHAVAVEWLGGDDWRLYEGDSCAGMAGGPFQARGTFTAAQVVVRTASPAAGRTQMIATCEAGGHRYLRGSVVADSFAVTGSSEVRQRTMNRVPVESYLRSVVPAESPASWGGNGSAPGMHALRAQAVAARSYALAGDTRYGLADTCDDIFCQVYKGHGFNAGGSVTVFESSNTDRAVLDTAGQVRRMPSGAVARTEFSSSTGGYTAGGTFPPVPDLGDSVSANPNHSWRVRLPASTIEAAFDARAGRDLGAFQGFTVLERNGLGADGGRVRSVRANFSGGQYTVTGNEFRSLFAKNRVLSDWFTPHGGATPPPPPPGPGGFTDTAGSAHGANIATVVDAGIAAGFPDGTYRPDDDVSRGQMATFLARGYRLPAATAPTFPDIRGDTHEANIRAIAAAGITTGDARGDYRPTDRVTRGQMAAFVARAEGLDLPADAAPLCRSDSRSFAREIRAVVDAGIAGGKADGCFDPDGPVTRGQMATFLVRALGL